MIKAKIFEKWISLIGLDFHVVITLLFRGWVVLAGGATAFFLPLWFSPIEQGYYFTFSSLLALQIFFELGLNQIIMQLVSHEVAHLTETPEGELVGNPMHLDRLSSLAHLILRWYGVAAFFFALVGTAVGAIFFSQRGGESVDGWLGIWMILVGATAVNLWLSPRFAVMEGCGKVGQVARLRLFQSVLGYAAFWVALLSGAGLWAAIAVPTVGAVCMGYWITYHDKTLRWLIKRPRDLKNQVMWLIDVFPLQWRIALSWASGYLIFNLFTPMVFSRYGAAEAGKLGIALTLFSALSTIGMSWVNAKAPQFTMFIARGERAELNRQFNKLFLRSMLFIAFACTSVVVIGFYSQQVGLPFMKRIVPPSVLAVLAITTTVNSIVYSMAIYMRAHREEPMLAQSIVMGGLIAFSVYVGSIFGVLVMMSLYMLMSISVSLPWAVNLFLKYYKKP